MGNHKLYHLIAIILTVAALSLVLAYGVGAQSANPCTEGQYSDFSTDGRCTPLVYPDLGFDRAKYDRASKPHSFALGSCQEADLHNLLDNVRKNGGGSVLLPECKMRLTRTLSLPSNTRISGQGIGKTVIVLDHDSTGVEFKNESNLILEDFTINGNRQVSIPLSLWRGNNALVQRIEVANSGRTGLVFRHFKGITIRYGDFHGSGKFHGISSKDCSSSSVANCERGDFGKGVAYTQNVAIYSNVSHGNEGHGIDVHIKDGLIAGNVSVNNGYAIKIPDSTNLLITNNVFGEGLNLWTVHAYRIQRSVRNVIWANNVFNGGIIRSGSDSQMIFYNNDFNGIDSKLSDGSTWCGSRIANAEKASDETCERVAKLVAAPVEQATVTPITTKTPTATPTATSTQGTIPPITPTATATPSCSVHRVAGRMLQVCDLGAAQ